MARPQADQRGVEQFGVLEHLGVVEDRIVGVEQLGHTTRMAVELGRRRQGVVVIQQLDVAPRAR